MDATKLIELLGGTTKVAEICDVTPGAVSQWKTNGVPKPWVWFFESKYPDICRAAVVVPTSTPPPQPA
ncbi:Cro/CI family transcriptional regulator [Undibacterium sp. Ji50W]|uniref:Cro/CI family transcriptional regulator n=1 Tax=Undibacterium sp. Ji50W TaxID=3413041 RepID=UPI003BF31E9A